jgi:hypothetical protein
VEYPEVIVLDDIRKPIDYRAVLVEDATESPGGCVYADDHPATIWYLESEGPLDRAFPSREVLN